MKTCTSINSIPFRKLLKRYKLKKRGKHEILKVAQKKSLHHSILIRLARKIEFKESITNKNKQL